MARREQRGIFGLNRQHSTLAIFLFVVITALIGMMQLWADPVYTSRSTVVVGQDKPLGLPEAAAALMSSDSIEDHLAVLESDLLSQHAIDELFLGCQLVPDWSPNPFAYQVSRVFAILFKTPMPLDYGRIDYPTVTALEYDYAKVNGRKLKLAVTNETEYALLEGNRVLARATIGEPLGIAGLSLAVNNFDPTPGQSWCLEFTDPTELVEATKLSLTVFRIGRRSNTLGVKFAAKHPQLAASVVTSMIDFYLARYIENTQQVSSEQLGYVEAEINRVEGEIEGLRQQSETLLGDRSTLIAGQGGASVPAAYLQVQQDLAALTTEQSQIDNLLKQIDTDQDYTGYFASNINPRHLEPTLVEDINDLQSQMASELVTKTEEHPDVVELRDRIATKRTDLHRLLNESQQQVKREVGRAGQQLGQYAHILDLSPETTTELSRINGEITLQVQTLGSLYVQKQLLSIRKISEVSPLTLLDGAEVNPQPVTPRVTRTAVSAVIFALLLTVALILVLRLVDPAVRAPIDLSNRFHLPVLATLSTDGRQADPLERHRLRLKLRQLAGAGRKKLAVAVLAPPTEAGALCTMLNSTRSGEPEFVALAGHGLAALMQDAAGLADGVVLAVSPGRRRLTEITALVNELEGTGVRLAGFLLLSGKAVTVAEGKAASNA